ncbi:MAG: hypothetical protein HC898_00360 [Phycisphaerales bacterium]|nr:hypothetical protein [Phycisphaerales bacterium]
MNWAKGWTAADAYGIFTGPANPTNPVSTAFVMATGFQADSGFTYVVESSADGINWTPETVVTGDGSYKLFVSDLGLSANLLHRVSVQ